MSATAAPADDPLGLIGLIILGLIFAAPGWLWLALAIFMVHGWSIGLQDNWPKTFLAVHVGLSLLCLSLYREGNYWYLGGSYFAVVAWMAWRDRREEQRPGAAGRPPEDRP